MAQSSSAVQRPRPTPARSFDAPPGTPAYETNLDLNRIFPLTNSEQQLVVILDAEVPLDSSWLCPVTARIEAALGSVLAPGNTSVSYCRLKDNGLPDSIAGEMLTTNHKSSLILLPVEDVRTGVMNAAIDDIRDLLKTLPGEAGAPKGVRVGVTGFRVFAKDIVDGVGRGAC